MLQQSHFKLEIRLRISTYVHQVFLDEREDGFSSCDFERFEIQINIYININSFINIEANIEN